MLLKLLAPLWRTQQSNEDLSNDVPKATKILHVVALRRSWWQRLFFLRYSLLISTSQPHFLSQSRKKWWLQGRRIFPWWLHNITHYILLLYPYVTCLWNKIWFSMDAFRMFLDACCSKEPPCRLASDMEKSSISRPHLAIAGGIPYFQINPNIIFLVIYIYIYTCIYYIIIHIYIYYNIILYTHTLGQLLRFPAGFFALPFGVPGLQTESLVPGESQWRGAVTLDDFWGTRCDPYGYGSISMNIPFLGDEHP